MPSGAQHTRGRKTASPKYFMSNETQKVSMMKLDEKAKVAYRNKHGGMLVQYSYAELSVCVLLFSLPTWLGISHPLQSI